MESPFQKFQAAIDAADAAMDNALSEALRIRDTAVASAKEVFQKMTTETESPATPKPEPETTETPTTTEAPAKCPKCGDTGQASICSKCGHVLSVIVLFLFSLLFGARAYAQNPTPTPTPVPGGTTSTVQVSIGAQAFTLGMGTGGATVGTDMIAKVQFKGALSLRSDNILVPSTDFQCYTGGIQYNLPIRLLASTSFSALQGYLDASVGVDRIVPASGPSSSHFALLAGGGLNWQQSTNMIVNIVEVRIMHAPGNPSGTNVPVVSGGISLFF